MLGRHQKFGSDAIEAKFAVGALEGKRMSHRNRVDVVPLNTTAGLYSSSSNAFTPMIAPTSNVVAPTHIEQNLAVHGRTVAGPNGVETGRVRKMLDRAR